MIKKLLQGLLIGLIAGAVVLAFSCRRVKWSHKLLRDWEYKVWDHTVSYTYGPTLETDKINLIFLDQESLEWGMGEERRWSWPWPRTVYGAVVDFCKRGGAKAVIFDVVYTEPSMHEGDDETFGTAIVEVERVVAAVRRGGGAGSSS